MGAASKRVLNNYILPLGKGEMKRVDPPLLAFPFKGEGSIKQALRRADVHPNSGNKEYGLISHHDLNGFGNIGEGIHLHQTRDGRRILYLAHESAPKDITSVDVTDIANPKIMVQTELEYGHLRSNSRSIVGDTMPVAYQSEDPGNPAPGWAYMTLATRKSPAVSAF